MFVHRPLSIGGTIEASRPIFFRALDDGTNNADALIVVVTAKTSLVHVYIRQVYIRTPANNVVYLPGEKRDAHLGNP